MTNTIAVRLAALLGFLAVTLGAFGADGLKDTLAKTGSSLNIQQFGTGPGIVFGPSGMRVEGRS